VRYRPFGRSGVSVSAVGLTVGDNAARHGAEHVRALVYAALEAGVNTYHIATGDPDAAEVIGEALAAVERRLVFVSLRVGVTRTRTGVERDFSPEALTAQIDRTIGASGLGHIDLALLDDPAGAELQHSALAALKSLRATGRVTLLGVSGENDSMDAYLSSNAFDILALPYHLRSGWKERNRLKTAISLDMGVMAYGFYPESLSSPKKVEAIAQPVRRGLFGGKTVVQEAASPLQGAGTYAFLHQTKNWTAEEICLAYALTDTAISCVLVDAVEVGHFSALAAVPDRDMPPGLAAQIEMARFSPGA
jgi:aryl-alcohol dehydrogenase-like predicted oxidoreductase